MCGIAGYYGYSADRTMLRAMNDAIAHRGPDGEGYHLEGLLGFAHRRLAFLDVAHGQEPITSQDGQTTLIYNGEVYNYLELRAELEGQGRSFITQSDTEVVLQAYEEWGTEAFDRLNGMFAFAIYDKKLHRLVLARDHFGIKPLYYATPDTVSKEVDDNGFPISPIIFGSEIRALLASQKITPAVNERILYRYLQFRIHDEEPDTFFQGIKKLMPGQMLLLDTKTGAYDIQPFTQLIQELKQQASRETPYTQRTVAEYRERLNESIRMRLQSEVPLGSALSGGLDSSSVVATIHRLLQDQADGTDALGSRQQTFTAIFPNSINDEERYADAVLHQCGDQVTSHKIAPTAEEFAEDLVDFVRTQEEPVISSGPYAQYRVMQEASRHVKALLDGQGADEMMAGYVPYYFAYLRQLRKRRQYNKLIEEVFSSTDILFRLVRFQLLGKLKLHKGASMADLLTPDFAKAHAHERFSNIPDNLKLRLIDDIFYKSLPSVLRYEDKNTMRFSIEGRVPFLDKEVLKFLFTLSDEAIIKDGWNKRILRDAMRGILPSTITDRRNKIGFTTPEAEWFLTIQKNLYEIFLSPSFSGRPYWNQEAVVHAFEQYTSGKYSGSTLVFWRLCNTELWLREFIDPPQASEPKEEKDDYTPNAGKALDLPVPEAGGTPYRRYPLRTEVFYRDTALNDTILHYIRRFFAGLEQAAPEHRQAVVDQPWYLFVSEKIVAMTQGRSIPVWDIHVSTSARLLSRFVTKNPGGIGLGSPWSMQLAIREVGLPRVLWAAFRSVLGKLRGKSGVFYEVVGHHINAIDGAAGYQVGTSTHSVKYAPEDPDGVAQQLSALIRAQLPEDLGQHFAGTAILDANDLGVVALGHDTNLSSSVLEGIFRDNPQGQSTETTPISLVFPQSVKTASTVPPTP